MLKLRRALLLLTIFLIINPMYGVKASDRTVFATIIDAYYDDLDGDGVEDDVRLSVRFDFLGFGESDYKNGIQYGALLGLVLPSGMDFWYDYNDVDNRSVVIVDFNLMNHALENGWYEAYASGYYKDLRPDKGLLAHYIVFDPPGGQPGGDPQAFAVKR